MRTVAFLAVAAFCLSSTPAFAQLTEAEENAELEQMDCVYNGVSDDALMALARAYEGQADISEAMAKSVNTAHEACVGQHGWDEHRGTMAYEAAVAGAVVDILMNDLEDAGMASPDNLIGVWNDMADEDVAVLLVDGWRAKPDLVTRLRPTLISAGVPNSDAAVNKAMTVFEAVTYGSLLTEEWLSAAAERKSGDKSSQ